MDYLALRNLHVLCVLASGTLFLLRGSGMLARQDWYLRGAWRFVPHVIDTVLLLSAIGLLLVLSGSPLTQAWLIAKLIALPFYIVLGNLALKRGREYHHRVLAFVAAATTFAYIFSVARSRSPLGLFS